MNKFAIALCAMLAVMFAVSCSERDVQDKTAIAVDGHTSQNALDWAGSYRGTLPCADCPGILTIVNLAQNGTFDLFTQYLKNDDTGELQRGNFTWSEDGRNITLRTDPPRHFQVGENILFTLDTTGQRIDGALADAYKLTKIPDADVAEHYWKLVRLYDRTVPVTNRDVHIILKRDGNRVTGSGGCNMLGGVYALQGDDGLTFGDIASTEMACPTGMDTEQEFLALLAKVNFYTISGDTLMLFGADKQQEIARFHAVYLY